MKFREATFIAALGVCLVAILFLSASAGAADVTLAWDDPGHPEWGTRILIGTEAGTYTYSHDAGPGVTQTTVPNLVPGTTYYMAAVHYYQGNESGLSNEVSHAPESSETVFPPLPDLPDPGEILEYVITIRPVE